jgi:hypothetical protein
MNEDESDEAERRHGDGAVEHALPGPGYSTHSIEHNVALSPA